MKLVRSDSPEAARGIASARTLARRPGPMFLLGLLPNLVILLIALAGLTLSKQAASLIALPLFLAWNAWVLWRTRSPRLSWVIKAGANQVYIRLWVGFGAAWRASDIPDVLVLESTEIVSVSLRATEVFLYGPKPKLVEWLVIEPSQAVAGVISNQTPPSLGEARTRELCDRVFWAKDERHLAVGWESCRPSVQILLEQIVREFPSIVIGPEERFELDLNGIWHGYRESPNADQRRMLAQAERLGFHCDLAGVLSQRKRMGFRAAGAYLAEIQKEEAWAGQSAISATCYTRKPEDSK